MKFLLVGINAKYIHSNPAIYSLAAYAGQKTGENGIKNAEQIELAEYTINQNAEDILADLYKRRADVVGFSCYIWNIRMVLELAEQLHQICPEVPIWLGGPEVSYDPEKRIEQNPYLSGIMVGEGEETFSELLQLYIRQEKDGERNITPYQAEIAGIVTSEGRTKERGCMDLNRIPFFYEKPEEFKNRIIYYESSRGCPYHCSYCLSSIDRNMRYRDLELVKKELGFFLEHEVPQVKFIDRTFNANQKHALEIWQFISSHDNGVTNFHFEIAADNLTEEEITLLNTFRPGLVQLEIGVQSTNQDTISAIHRVMNLDKVRKAVAAVGSGKNIHQHLDLIAGLPYEDYESFHHSFCEVYAMKPQQLQLGFLKVLKGALMEEEASRYEIVYRMEPPYEVLYTKWISFGEMIHLKQIEAMVELFYNSSQFRNTMKYLEYEFDDSFVMFEKLAEYYEKNGYFTMSPKRLYYYEILFRFCIQAAPAREEQYRELLTYDCYLRENLKSRPAFSEDLTVYKDRSRKIYEREEKERSLLADYKDYDKRQLEKMTHLEYFYYPVYREDFSMKKERSKQPDAILFDYKKHNPLTEDCRIIQVQNAYCEQE